MNSYGYCIKCHRYRERYGRRLCSTCYTWHWNRGTLDLYPRTFWKNEELIEELDFWRERGLSVRQAAERIQVSLSAARKAIQRAKERRCQAANPSSDVGMAGKL